MVALLFILLLVSHLEAGAARLRTTSCLYRRPGDNVVLSLRGFGTCDSSAWTRDGSVPRGRLLRQGANCSLHIDNVTAEDAGCYSSPEDTLCLYVVSVSDAGPQRGSRVTLQCSLIRAAYYRPCGQGNILWLDEAGTELLHDDDACEVAEGTCVSNLTVDADPGRTYTCQVMDDTYDVMIEANHTLVFRDAAEWSPLSFVMLTLRVSVLILMIVITVLIVIKTRKEKQDPKSQRVMEVSE
ncbi:uncharacterized protein LOC131443736 isoform X1 [Solea solea]|uniref:uncharacterized protein LOC131443736 isoform X1 n=1 Tax=Solea solea TaxID=90069 RepID=UPI00272958C3|nr:uncharacterized protein LOC131443736 isoform X1 [Solea solea]